MGRAGNLDRLAIVNPFPQALSYSPVGLNSATKTDGTHSDNQAMFGFTALDSETLNEIWIYLATTTGTPSTSNIVCDIFAADTTTNSAPTGASLGQATISSVTSNGWRSFTGLSIALTAGSRYFAVIRNKEATPASNFVRVQCNDNGNIAISTFSYELTFGSSTNGGSTWSLRRAVTCFFAVFASGKVSGRAFAELTVNAEIYSTREYGTKYTIPGSGSVPIAGGIFYLAGETGNPTGDVVLKAYNDTTLIATSLAIPDAIASNSAGYYVAIFPDSYSFSAGAALRLVVAVTSGGDSSNKHNVSKAIVPETTASRAAYWGNPIETYYTGTWADGGGYLPNMSPLVDLEQLPAAGGGMIGGGNLRGGFQ